MLEIYKGEAWLRSTYAETGSIYKMAELAGCHKNTIYLWMKKYKIPMHGMKGQKHTAQAKKKISASSSKKTPPMEGKRHSEQTRLAMSLSRQGEKNANWKGGATAKAREFRRSKEYVAWVKSVINRANGCCEICGCSKRIEAHHIVGIGKDFSKALEIENGMALCHQCHREIHRREKDAKHKN